MKVTMAMLFALCLSAAVLFAEPLTDNQARFGKITGDVGLLSQGAMEWIEPHEGLPIEPGDHVRTGEDGEAEISVSENVLWIMRPQTDLTTERMETHRGRFNLSNGTVFGKVDSVRASSAQHWEWNTPTAVCAIRGTEFVLDVSKEEGTHLGVFEGEVEMGPAEGVGGLPAPMRVSGGSEGILARGKTLRVLPQFGSRMQVHLSRRADLQARLAYRQGTWSPFTPTVRQELRHRFVSPPSLRRPKAAPGQHRQPRLRQRGRR